MPAINVTKENFDKIISSSTGPVLVDFWAAWCGPCRMQAPILEEFSNKEKNILILKVNVDSEPEIADKFNIRAIPTLIVFKNGKPVNQHSGVLEHDQLLQLVNFS